VQPVIPNVVTLGDDNTTVVGIEYSRLTAVLIEAVKQLSTKIDQISAKLP